MWFVTYKTSFLQITRIRAEAVVKVGCNPFYRLPGFGLWLRFLADKTSYLKIIRLVAVAVVKVSCSLLQIRHPS